MTFNAVGKVLLVVFLMLSACVLSGASPVPETVSEPPEPVCDLLPRDLPQSFPLRFSMLGRDFGRVSDSATVRFQVWLQNVSGAEVMAAYQPDFPGSSCGYMPIRRLAPGEKRHLDVTFNPTHRCGEYEKFIFIEVAIDGGAHGWQTIKLPLKAFIVPRVMFTPMKMYLMEVPTTTGKDTTIEVCGHGHNFDIAFISVLSATGGPASDPLRISKGQRESIVMFDEPYVKIAVTVTVPAGTPIGEHDWTIRFEYSGVDEQVGPMK